MPSAPSRRAVGSPRAWQARCSPPHVNDRHHTPDSARSDNSEFYSELKWCNDCHDYVRFLMSINHSYCVTCGARVRLFNRDDSRAFQDHVQRHKWQAS
jgi:hypothetical protein